MTLVFNSVDLFRMQLFTLEYTLEEIKIREDTSYMSRRNYKQLFPDHVQIDIQNTAISYGLGLDPISQSLILIISYINLLLFCIL